MNGELLQRYLRLLNHYQKAEPTSPFQHFAPTVR
jgi:hypothetical protein